MLDELSWAVLDAALYAAPHPALLRSAALTRRHGDDLSAAHRRVLDAIQLAAGPI